jgi:hypothetical protein
MAIKRDKGYIYFAEFAETGYIKIGWTSNVQNRLKDHERESRQQLRLLNYFSGSIRDEQELHVQFGDYAIEKYKKSKRGRRCELYHPARAITDYIDALGANGDNVRLVNERLRRPYEYRRGLLSCGEVSDIRGSYSRGVGFDAIRNDYRVSVAALIRILSGSAYKKCPGPTIDETEIIERERIFFSS